MNATRCPRSAEPKQIPIQALKRKATPGNDQPKHAFCIGFSSTFIAFLLLFIGFYDISPSKSTNPIANSHLLKKTLDEAIPPLSLCNWRHGKWEKVKNITLETIDGMTIPYSSYGRHFSFFFL